MYPISVERNRFYKLKSKILVDSPDEVTTHQRRCLAIYWLYEKLHGDGLSLVGSYHKEKWHIYTNIIVYSPYI